MRSVQVQHTVRDRQRESNSNWVRCAIANCVPQRQRGFAHICEQWAVALPRLLDLCTLATQHFAKESFNVNAGANRLSYRRQLRSYFARINCMLGEERPRPLLA